MQRLSSVVRPLNCTKGRFSQRARLYRDMVCSS
jgi:hypothetical protein